MDDERRQHQETKLPEPPARAHPVQDQAIGAMPSATIMRVRIDRPQA